MQVQIGDIIKSFDFAGVDNYYMIGEVTEIDDEVIVAKIIKVVADGKTVKNGYVDVFRTPMQGSMIFDDRFERVIVIG